MTSLETLPQILSALAACQAEEAELSNSLSDLLAARDPIVTAIGRLQSLLPSLDELHVEANSFSNKVNITAQTADNVGTKVRNLDEEMRRLREAADRVGQVIELKSSLSSLQFAINSQDWEAAARHCARAMSLPLEVISGPFSESAVPTAESHLPPAQTLQSAREHLLTVFRRNFDQAAQERDANAVTRFFKLFPAIGWEDEGLQAYASFVVDLVRLRTPATAKTSSPLYYITALTSLFESIAMIVQQHQPIVEKYYGPHKMKDVIERLMQECDRVVKSLLQSWEEERSTKRKLTDASSNPPVFFNPVTAGKKLSAPEESSVDPREIDKILVELAAMAGRWNVFRKYMTEMLSVGNGDDDDDSTSTPAEKLVDLTSTASSALFEEMLHLLYTPLEVWYIRTIVGKAHRLSSPDLSQTIAATTVPDDVFYILKVTSTRIVSTGSLRTVDKMLGQFREIMEQDYIGVLKKKMEDVYRGSAPSGPSRGEKVEKENRIAFMTILNDLDVSSSHMERLCRDLMNSELISQQFLQTEQVAVKDRITSFAASASKIRSNLRVGIEQLFNQLMRPKLRALISEVYKDVSYVLDEDSYAVAEYQDVVRKRFVKTWENLMDGYKDTFTDNNFRTFFGLALDVLLRPWEKMMLGFKYTELGAIRFDRDLRSITTYLSSLTAFGDVREKFTRLQQISTLLNLDSDEDVDEFYNGSGITWKLTLQEARTIVLLKT